MENGVRKEKSVHRAAPAAPFAEGILAPVFIRVHPWFNGLVPAEDYLFGMKSTTEDNPHP